MGSQNRSREQIAETAEKLGRGIDREIRAMDKRMLKGWSEQSVVHREPRMRGMSMDCGGGLLDISHHQGRIGGSLDQDELQIFGLLDHPGQHRGVAACHADRLEAERLDNLMHQMLASAVERLRIDERAA